jgi:hypothetical protein
VIASVAVRCTAPPPAAAPPPADPLGTGANAAAVGLELFTFFCNGSKKQFILASSKYVPPALTNVTPGSDNPYAADREYIPYREFAKLKRDKKKNEKRGGGGGGDGGTSPLAQADLEVLCFCLDGLVEAMEAGGVSPAAALEPWAAMREDFEAATSSTFGPSHSHPPPPPLMECAARAAATAARCVRLPTGDVSAADGHNNFGDGDDDGADVDGRGSSLAHNRPRV